MPSAGPQACVGQDWVCAQDRNSITLRWVWFTTVNWKTIKKRIIWTMRGKPIRIKYQEHEPVPQTMSSLPCGRSLKHVAPWLVIAFHFISFHYWPRLWFQKYFFKDVVRIDACRCHWNKWQDRFLRKASVLHSTNHLSELFLRKSFIVWKEHTKVPRIPVNPHHRYQQELVI